MSGLLEADPVSFSVALASDRILPGDRLILLDGVYSGSWNSVWSGTEAAPITVEPLHHGKVTIDGSMTMDGDWQKWSDLDFTDSAVDRTSSTPGITMNHVGDTLIGCHVHHLRGNGVSWMGSGVGAIRECWFEENGWNSETDTFGHAIYSHNNTGGLREIARCLFGNQVGDYTIHIYSGGENYLRDFWVHHNIVLGDAVHCGGGLGLKNLLFEYNYIFGDWAQIGRYNLEGTSNDGIIRNNDFVAVGSLTIPIPAEFTISDNRLMSDSEMDDPPAGIVKSGLPATYSIEIPFTESKRWAGMQCNTVGYTMESHLIDL
jgi:hypothetical protein